jgi:hypothetical protein
VAGDHRGVGRQRGDDRAQHLGQALGVATARRVGVREGTGQHDVADARDAGADEVHHQVAGGVAARHRQQADDVAVEVDRGLTVQRHGRLTRGVERRQREVASHLAAGGGLGDDDRPRTQHRVAAGVVGVTVGVDDDPDRAAVQLGQDLLDRRRGAVVAGVHQEDAVIADRRDHGHVAVAAQQVERAREVAGLDRWGRVGVLGGDRRGKRGGETQQNEAWSVRHFESSLTSPDVRRLACCGVCVLVRCSGEGVSPLEKARAARVGGPYAVE